MLCMMRNLQKFLDCDVKFLNLGRFGGGDLVRNEKCMWM